MVASAIEKYHFLHSHFRRSLKDGRFILERVRQFKVVCLQVRVQEAPLENRSASFLPSRSKRI